MLNLVPWKRPRENQIDLFRKEIKAKESETKKITVKTG